MFYHNVMCVGLGMVCDLAVVFAAGGLVVCVARGWGVDVCLRCMCSVGVRGVVWVCVRGVVWVCGVWWVAVWECLDKDGLWNYWLGSSPYIG